MCVGGQGVFTYADYARMARMSARELERECSAEAFHGHGPGGQGVNTADSAVRMTHLPTGIVVVSRESRSQFRNRQLCLQKIREELRRRSIRPVVRRATKPTKASDARRLQQKRARSEVKKLRGRLKKYDD